jgi:alkylation response protein AidB-like acyl-CoA dehydrogenase
MNFDLTDDQMMMRDMFAGFLDEHSSIGHVRAAMDKGGFDAALWQGLGEQGALAIRAPESAGGLGLGVFDALLLMQEAGRTLVSGPLAEALVAGRLLAEFGASADLLAQALSGEAVVTLAFEDVAEMPRQWIAGGAVAQAIIAKSGDDIVLVSVGDSARQPSENLASTPMAQIDFASLDKVVLGSGADARATFAAGIEEWKLLIAAGLGGIGREALRLASVYACERKQFGQFIGEFQGISHPLADRHCDVEGGIFLTWKAVRDIADGAASAGAAVSVAHWWASKACGEAVAQALHTFGGYGLTTEYDIYLYNLRAKAWPLVQGDPEAALAEAGERLYGDVKVALPDVGDVAIDFDLGDDARAIADEIHKLFADHVTPEMREKFHYSWEGYNPELNRKLAEANLLYLGLPTDVGGRGLSPYAKVAAMDAFEIEGYSTPAAGVSQMVALIIHRFGSDELKAEVLPQIMRGDVICSLGYSEPGAGSDVFAAQCRATPDGDNWKIDGTKMFTSGANLSSYVLMLCRTNTEVPKHKGLTMFIVPLKADGVTIQPVYTFQDERTNITFYDGVTIPDSWRLGPVDGGVRTMSASLELEHAGGFSKYQRKMLEAANELCGEIVRGGKKLIDQPDTRTRLARTLAHIWISDLFTWHANWVIAEKKQNFAYGPRAKLFSSEKFLTDARDLLDLTAPYSLETGTGPAGELNLFYRHAQGATIYGGTSEVHRSMIAERALSLPRTRG